MGYSEAMRPLGRLLLIWLLLLAVPLQGMAAAARLHCASGVTRDSAPAGAPVSEALHAGLVEGMHDHAVHRGQHPQDAGSDVGADAERGASHRCSACAACCPLLGLPVQTLLLPVSPPGAPPAVAVVVSRESFVPFGLDRPPRITGR